MSRSITEIYNSLIDEKVAMTALNGMVPTIDSGQTFLEDITSASKVAVWRSMFFVIAFAIWTNEQLFDEHKQWIENRALELIIGNPDWHVQRALEFQYGDALEIINGVAKYPVVNLSNRIVKLVSVNEVNGQVYMKVAKLSSDEPIALTAPELAAFENYMQKIKFAGVIVNCLSRDADLLRIQYHVYVNPTVMNLNGELLSDPSIKPVEIAIKTYCKNLPFNGVWSSTQQTDKIQMAQGVVDPVFESASAQYGANPFVVLGDYYNPNAGYLRIDPAFPLTDSIKYLYKS